MIENKFSEYLGKNLIKITTISQATGISRTTLTNLYYKRTTKLSFEVLDLLCIYLGCSLTDIIDFKL